MSEDKHAQLLAQWLSAAPGTVPPDGLDEETMAAVYALAPDRAPAHRVRIDDVLSTLVSGPVADREVAEAAIALNPDLAPDHRVDINEILDSVTTGPFAEASQPVVDLAAARRRRNWWAGAGAFAAAAVALFIVIPISHKAQDAPKEHSAQTSTPDADSNKVSSRKARPKAAKRARKNKEELQGAPVTATLQGEITQEKEALKIPEPRQPSPDAEPQPAQVQMLEATLGIGDGVLAGTNSFPPGLGTTGSRAPTKSTVGSVPSSPPAAPPAAVQEDDAAGAMDMAQAGGNAGTVDSRSGPRTAEKKRRRSATTLAEQAPAMEADEEVGEPQPTNQEEIQTRALGSVVRQVTRLTPRNPTKALARLRSALARYPLALPMQRARAHRQEAIILEQLGRDAEAKEAKKKANNIESAN